MKEIRFIESLDNVNTLLTHSKENWFVLFVVGFSRTEFNGKGETLEEAFKNALKYWVLGKELWEKFI